LSEHSIIATMKKLFSFSIASLLLICSYGQSKQDKQLAESIDELLSAQFKQTEPGVAILIAKNENIVYEKAFGSANIELDVAMQPDGFQNRLGDKTIYSSWHSAIGRTR